MNTTNTAGNRPNDYEAHLGKRPRDGDGKFTTTVNGVAYGFADPIPDGGQILAEAGFLPAADHVLIQRLKHGSRSIGLDEGVDLREPGTEAFQVFKSDRVFNFTIDGRGYEWGAPRITEPELRKLADIQDDEILVLERDGKDRVLDANDNVSLEERGTEHLHVSKRLVTVYYENEEKRIPGGVYTTEQLIDLFGVPAGYLLNYVNAQGQLTPLKPGEKLRVRDGQKFFKQAPCGGSS